MTTAVAFNTSITGLTIAGVNKQYNHRPESLDGSRPWVSFPEAWPSIGTNESYTTTCDESGKEYSMRLWVVVDAIGQSTPSVKYAAVLAAQDALWTALNTFEGTSDLDINFSIGGGVVNVGGIGYEAAYADITGTVF